MSSHTSERTLLSFTIPCYRSEQTIRKVVDEIKETVLQKQDEYDYEIVCVNDCSPDDVWTVLQDLAAEDQRVKAINMAVNRGKHAALMAAFAHVKGEIVVAVDDDGETPVPELWNLIDPLYHGYDVAIASYGVRPVSKLKKLESDANDFISSILYNKPRGLKFSNFVARKKFVCDYIVDYPGPFPMLEGATLEVTRNIAQVPMNARSRFAGTSGFTFRRGLSLMLNGCTTYSYRPLRIGWWITGGFSAAGLVSLVVSLMQRKTKLAPAVLFGFALVFVYLSLLAEYVGRAYLAINRAHQFIEKESINLGK